MQYALEQAVDRAEQVIESTQQRPPKRKCLSTGEQSLHQKLYDIYVEECEKEPEFTEELKTNVNLLEKLVKRESQPCLVVNLYPGNEGYSLMLQGEDGSYSETIRLPYEQRELLEYLDAEELPPVLLDILERSQVNLFQDGCVIAEVRDYRQSSNVEVPDYQSRHILLRPTMQTLACDVQAIASEHREWTEEDKLQLESQLLLATSEPLCLEPSVTVACTANRLLYNQQKMNSYPMRQNFKRHSVPSLNRQQELADYSTPPELKLLTCWKKSKEKKAVKQHDLKIAKAGSSVDLWKQRPCELAVPSEVDVEKYAKGKKMPDKHDATQPAVCPTPEVNNTAVPTFGIGDQSQTISLNSTPSLNDILYSSKETTRSVPMPDTHTFTNEHSYSAVPESVTHAGKVVNQPEQLVQKNSKCPVMMSPSSSNSANVSQISSGTVPEKPEVVLIETSVPGKGVQHPFPPITLLSSSGESSSGNNSFTPQKISIFHPSPSLASTPQRLPQISSAEVHGHSIITAASQITATSSRKNLATATQVMVNSAGPMGSNMESNPATSPQKTSHQMCRLVYCRHHLKRVFKNL
ncbi:transcription factor SPT20 homolog [Erinaceus europaeus]|uniref:Transcription factor SPT20 homolog n=1 Tax=Erinaceus europaeus TaxID=9365 RepID=A0ABM3WV10_ERIEU|nr:transcription factor SPT20 homolog [Erinaceus europaeus]